jgi:hypothetical protein
MRTLMPLLRTTQKIVVPQGKAKQSFPFLLRAAWRV